MYGPVAHLVERLVCTEEAGGSSPLWSTIAIATFAIAQSPKNSATTLFLCFQEIGVRSVSSPEAGEVETRY